MNKYDIRLITTVAAITVITFSLGAAFQSHRDAVKVASILNSTDLNIERNVEQLNAHLDVCFDQLRFEQKGQ